MFRLEPDMSLAAIVASNKSDVTHMVARPTSLFIPEERSTHFATYRMLENSDEEERWTMFGTDEHDKALRKLLRPTSNSSYGVGSPRPS